MGAYSAQTNNRIPKTEERMNTPPCPFWEKDCNLIPPASAGKQTIRRSFVKNAGYKKTTNPVRQGVLHHEN